MGWQTSKPSVVGSWATFATKTVSANKYQVVLSVKWARMTNNGIAVELKQNTYEGSTSTYKPPDYMDYSITITGTTSHTEDWGVGGGERYYVTAKTIYWTGTISNTQSMTVKVGAHDSGGGAFSHQTYINTTKSAPAYVSQYTLSFNGNGQNSGSTASITKTWSTTISLPANGFQKTGYTFVGWNTNSAGTGTTYQPGASYTITADVTLYAKWSQITYPVTYNGNAADGGSTASQTKVWGTPLTLQANGFTRTNYTFLYWNTAADGSGTTYNAGASYTANAVLTLYAIWKKNNIPVFINDSGTIIQVEKAFINDGGTIKECIVYQNLNGTIATYQ